MKSKSIIAGALLAGALAFTGIPSNAQTATTTPAAPPTTTAPDATPGPGHHGHGDRMAMMIKYLGLTPDQQAKIKPILDSQKTQMMAVRADTTLTDDQRKAKMRAIGKDTMTQVHAILTPDQIAKMKALREQMRQRREAAQSTAAPAPSDDNQ